MEYYSAIKNTVESVLMRWMKLEPIIQSEVSQKEKHQYSILMHKAIYCYTAYLISVQSTSYEMPGWMKHKLESRLLGEISMTSDTQMTPPLSQKVKKN